MPNNKPATGNATLAAMARKRASKSFCDHQLEERSGAFFGNPTIRPATDTYGDYLAIGVEQNQPGIKNFCNSTWDQCMKTGFLGGG
jgi:hypothetical protein